MTEEETRDELMTGPSNARERLRKTRDHDSTNNGPQLGDGLAGMAHWILLPWECSATSGKKAGIAFNLQSVLAILLSCFLNLP